jgi:hypothetical protein
MNNASEAVKYINSEELTTSNCVKIGNSANKLVVSFSSNGHDGFERKGTLMNLRDKRTDFDVLYLRNRNQWFLGELLGPGTNSRHTLDFLKKEFSRYDKVICTGFSAGGYASILYGSLLGVSDVVVVEPQTDLDYVVKKFEPMSKIELPGNKYLQKKELTKIKSVMSPRLMNCRNILKSDVRYHYFTRGDNNLPSKFELILHGDYHYDQIKNFPTVKKYFNGNPFAKLIECLDCIG